MLGNLETQLFSWIQLYNRDLLKTGGISKILGLNPKQERELLSRLSRKGLIVRLMKGLYLVPKKLPPGGKWVAHPYILVTKLMDTLGADYQISGPTAFQAYGFSEQVPNTTFIYNDQISGKRKIAGQSFYFIKIAKDRLGGVRIVKMPDGTEVKMSNLPRTCLDAVYDWSRFNTLPRAYDWIRSQSKKKEIIKDLVQLTLKYGNVTTSRRIGYLLESMNVPSRWVNQIKNSLPESKTLESWIPNQPRQGKVNREWGLVING